MALRISRVVLVGLLALVASATARASQVSRSDDRATAQAGHPSEGSLPTTRAINVLVVVNDDPDRPYVQQAVAGLRRALRDRSVNGVLYTEFFDQVRFGDRPDYPEEFRAWLEQKYANQHLDGIVVRGQGALQLFARRPGSLWNDLPIVYGTLGPLTIDIRETHPTASGVVMDNHFPLLMQVIRTLVPGTQRIAAIRGAAPTEREREAWWLPQIRDAGFDIMDLVGLPMDELLARVSSLPENTVPLFLSYVRDPAGRMYEPSEAPTLIEAASNRPFFTLMNNGITERFVGGPRPDMLYAGHETGLELLARLAGKPPSTRTLPLSRLSPLVFDAVGLARWSISESRLPPGSTVVNRPPSLWRNYRGTVIATLTVGAVLVTLLTVTLIERRQRAQAQGALRSSYVQLQDLTDRLLTAQEEERARIARDLHDDIGQRVASLAIALSRLKRQASVPEAVTQSVSELQRETTRLSKDLRQLSHDLHPGALEHLGLVQAIRARCNEFNDESGTPVRFDVSDGWREVPDAVALCLYRVAQEALRNVAVHAHARRVVVALDKQDGHLMMRVSDDGQGFDPSAVGGAGLGLVSLGERVRMLGGRLDVTAQPGTGTDVVVTLPAER